MSTEDLSSLSCSFKLFFKIIIIYFVLFYSLCCSLLGTGLLLSITVYIYSALHFASHILRITFFSPWKPFQLHDCYSPLLWSSIMSHDSLYGTVWRKAVLFWNTKNSFYTSSKMFAIPQILTQANLTKKQHKSLKTRRRIPHSICCSDNAD